MNWSLHKDKNVIAIKSLFFLCILLQNSLSLLLGLFNLDQIILSLILTLNSILPIIVLMMRLMLLNMMLFLEPMLCLFRLLLILITIQTSFNTYLLNDLIDGSHLILLQIAWTSLYVLRIRWLRSDLLLGSIMTALRNLLFRLFARHFSWVRGWFFSMSAPWHRLFIILCRHILSLVASVDTSPLVGS